MDSLTSRKGKGKKGRKAGREVRKERGKLLKTDILDISEEKGRKKNERDKNKQKTAKRIRAKGCRLRDTFTDLNHAKALA